jgi:hypothetical protein
VPTAKAVVSFTLTLLLASCSHQKRLSKDELRSQLRSTASFAAETELFVQYVQQNRATRPYARGHAEYLGDEVRRLAEELRNSSVAPELQQKLEVCRTQVEGLANALSELPSEFADPDALASAQQKIRDIQRALDVANSSL